MADVPLDGEFRLTGNTAAILATYTQPIPKNLIVREEDTGKVKIGDGVLRYSLLPYAIDAVLTAAQSALLTSFNTANKLVQLNGAGKIDVSMLPVGAGKALTFVADIAERDLIPIAERTHFVYVNDATADATVDAGWAIYVWNTVSTEWIKVDEGEGLDVEALFIKKTDFLIVSGGDGSRYA